MADCHFLTFSNWLSTVILCAIKQMKKCNPKKQIQKDICGRSVFTLILLIFRSWLVLVQEIWKKLEVHVERSMLSVIKWKLRLAVLIWVYKVC